MKLILFPVFKSNIFQRGPFPFSRFPTTPGQITLQSTEQKRHQRLYSIRFWAPFSNFMSEYWVSQAKYYCKVCNCYIADNKPSRQHHDNGAKHKEKVELLAKQKKFDKLHGVRSEAELRHQLAEIEKAAKEAIAADKADNDGSFYQVLKNSNDASVAFFSYYFPA
jgi:hypothetical protein